MTCHHTRSERKPYCVVCDPVHEWLMQHDMITIKAEQDRIIKLLENLDDEQWSETNLQIINLIKGENK